MLSWPRFFEEVCGLRLSPSVEGLWVVAQSAGWWWPFADAVILTERPRVLRRDDQDRLHASDGPALLYPDGWGIWAWHGVRVSQQVIEFPQTLTTGQIQREHNVEVRRVMMERFGLDRYLRESGSRRLSQDDFGELWRAEVPDDEPLVMLKVLNSTPEPDGSFRDYWLRVPPDMQTAHQASAWTMGFERAEDYQPAVQT